MEEKGDAAREDSPENLDAAQLLGVNHCGIHFHGHQKVSDPQWTIHAGS